MKTETNPSLPAHFATLSPAQRAAAIKRAAARTAENAVAENIAKLANAITRRMEMLHTGGRLRDKNGTACAAQGTGVPLSEIDRDEIKGEVTTSLCDSLASGQTEFRVLWRTASNAARRALYRVQKIHTFSSRASAETHGQKAHTAHLAACAGDIEENPLPEGTAILNAILTDLSEKETEISPAREYLAARRNLAAYWRAKTKYPRLRSDWKAQTALLSEVTRARMAGNFAAPAQRENEALHRRLARLAEHIEIGKSLRAAAPAPAPRRFAIISAIPRANPAPQSYVRLPTTREDLAADWCHVPGSLSYRLTSRASRASLESLAQIFTR